MSLNEFLIAESLSFLAITIGIPVLIATPAFLLARRANRIVRTTHRVPKREYILIFSLLVLGLLYTLFSRSIIVWVAAGPLAFHLDLGQDRYGVRRLPDGTSSLHGHFLKTCIAPLTSQRFKL